MINKEEKLLSAVRAFYPNQKFGTWSNQLDKERLLCVLDCLEEDEYPDGYLELGHGEGLWATNTRLLLVTTHAPLFGGRWKVVKQIEFPYHQIISVDFSSGNSLDQVYGISHVAINMPGRKTVCTTSQEIKTSQAPNFVELVRKNIKSASAESSQPSQLTQNTGLATQLERLNQLRLSGAISDEEYTLAKTKLLNS